MSDAGVAGNSSAGEQAVAAQVVPGGAPPPAAAPAGNGAAASPSPVANGSLADILDDGGSVDPAGEPGADDWRVAAAGGDEKLLRELKRYASPQNVAKALIDAKAQLRVGLQPPTLPEDATEKQIDEYRKLVGVPETPDGYEAKFSPEVLSLDKSLDGKLKNFLDYAHASHLPPAAVKLAVQWQERELLKERDELIAAAARTRAEVSDKLRQEYGSDVRVNLTLADEYMQRYPGLQQAKALLGYNLEFTRDMINMARENMDPDAVYAGDAEGGGKSLDEQIAVLRKESVDGTLTPAKDKRYMDLIAARERRNERRQRAS